MRSSYAPLADILFMKTYPIELRKRVLQVVDQNQMTRQEIAHMFDVSTFWIRKLLRQRRWTGSIAPLPRTQGRKPAFNQKQLQELDELVERRCDITLAEVREHFTGKVSCSLQAIANNLKRLGWGYKKNHYVRLSRKERM
jgi:transposase